MFLTCSIFGWTAILCENWIVTNPNSQTVELNLTLRRHGPGGTISSQSQHLAKASAMLPHSS